MGLMFYPRGGSAQLTRYIWEVRLAVGSLVRHDALRAHHCLKRPQIGLYLSGDSGESDVRPDAIDSADVSA